MRKIRVASGAGYAGDRIEPALDIITKGKADYIIFECLAERTIALAQKDKMENPDRGYNPLLEYRMERILPLLARHPVKIVSNMGAANPAAAARKIYEMACQYGLEGIKVAAVQGDDVLDSLSSYYDQPIIETGEPLSVLQGKILSANAYIGARPIADAFRLGADIVITGRVADPSLVVGPLMYEFDKPFDDFDFMGKCTVAGHLLECGGQVTGGYYADPGVKDVPNLWNLGFPILTFGENGSMVLEKLPGTGGILNSDTVKEQLLYEIQDPANYLTPDVVADFSGVTVEDLGNEEVVVRGAGGKPGTGMLKVSVGYLDGWIGEGEISYGGTNARARAELAAEIVSRRLMVKDFDTREFRTDLLGINSLYGKALPHREAPVEIRLRLSARLDTQEQAEAIGREVEALYTNGPAGGGGARGYSRKIISVASFLIPQEVVTPSITWEGGVKG